MKIRFLTSKACFAVVCTLFAASYCFASSPCQLQLECDYNHDCKVDMSDLSFFAAIWMEDLSGQAGAFLPAGIYVAPPEQGGLDTFGCGSISEPCQSITYGIERAQESTVNHVFVADSVYTENIDIVAGINLWGGFDPVTWIRKEPAQSNTILKGYLQTGHAKTLTADWIKLPTEISGFHIKGIEASGAGANSYAVWIQDSDSNLVIRDNYIYAGRGDDGADGTNGEGGIDGPDGDPGMGAYDQIGSVAYTNEWVGAAGTAGQDASAGGKGGSAGGGTFGIFVINSTFKPDMPTLTDNYIYAGRGGNGGDGGFGGLADGQGAGGGGGGGAGGAAYGIYVWNVASFIEYHFYNDFVGTNVGGQGGKGGNSAGNPGSAGTNGAGLDYYYQ